MQTTREIQNSCPANQASGYEMTNKPKTKKERTHGEKEGEKREKITTTLSQKKEEASNVSEQRDKGWIHVVRVHDTTHLAVRDNNTAGQQTLTNYLTQRKNERSRSLTRTS